MVANLPNPNALPSIVLNGIYIFHQISHKITYKMVVDFKRNIINAAQYAEHPT